MNTTRSLTFLGCSLLILFALPFPIIAQDSAQPKKLRASESVAVVVCGGLRQREIRLLTASSRMPAYSMALEGGTKLGH